MSLDLSPKMTPQVFVILTEALNSCPQAEWMDLPRPYSNCPHKLADSAIRKFQCRSGYFLQCSQLGAARPRVLCVEMSPETQGGAVTSL